MSQDQIFISHSKDDTDLLDELDRVFGKTGTKQYRASFEDQSAPVSEDLAEEINDSRAMFVVLGPNAHAKEHTKIWIGWEVGIAVQRNIPVWIIEDISSQARMPIPGVTDYIMWNSDHGVDRRMFRDIIESEFGLQNQTYSEVALAAEGLENPERNTDIEGSVELRSQPRYTKCPYSECGERFKIWIKGTENINCPSCRKSFNLDRRVMVGVYKDELAPPIIKIEPGEVVEWYNKTGGKLKMWSSTDEFDNWEISVGIQDQGSDRFHFTDEGIYKFFTSSISSDMNEGIVIVGDADQKREIPNLESGKKVSELAFK